MRVHEAGGVRLLAAVSSRIRNRRGWFTRMPLSLFLAHARALVSGTFLCRCQLTPLCYIFKLCMGTEFSPFLQAVKFNSPLSR